VLTTGWRQCDPEHSLKEDTVDRPRRFRSESSRERKYYNALGASVKTSVECLVQRAQP